MLTLLVNLVKKRILLISLLALLIISNSIWFYRYDRTVKRLVSDLADCKTNLTIISNQNNECVNQLAKLDESYRLELDYTKATYEKKLQECRNSKTKIKKIIEYKIKQVPVEKIKIVKELEKCNIQFIEVNNNDENNPEDIVKYYLDHIGY